MEDKPKYQTEVEQAMSMLGVGYDKEQPALIIEKPTKNLSLNDKGLVEYKVWGWVKTSANFIYHIRKLKGAKLSVWQTIALSIDEDGICKYAIKDLVALTGYSRSEVIESVKELDEMGYLSVTKETGRANIYEPNFAARGENNPTNEPVQKNDQSSFKYSHPSSPPIGNNTPTIKELKELNDSSKQQTQAGVLLGFEKLKQDSKNFNGENDEALKAFENGMHTSGSWSWYPAKSSDEAKWRKFRRTVCEIYAKDSNAFEKYNLWRGKKDSLKSAKSNSQIAMNPDVFAESYNDFLLQMGQIGNPDTTKEYKPRGISA